MGKYYTLFVSYRVFVCVLLNFIAKQVYVMKEGEELHSACVFQSEKAGFSQLLFSVNLTFLLFLSS